MSLAPARWFLVPRPQPQAKFRLICFPHAGAGASTFFAWATALAPLGIEVRAIQYPGRETRFSEAFLTSSRALVQELISNWETIAGTGPFALFGHSMGSLLAFEVALALRRDRTSRRPKHLFLSGYNPPHIPSRLPILHTLPDAELLPAVAAHYGALPAELMANRELSDLLTPVFRADFTVVDTYTWENDGRVDLPITALGGRDDPWTSEAELAEWKRHTTQNFRLKLFPGGHFFHQENQKSVLEIVQAIVESAGIAH